METIKIGLLSISDRASSGVYKDEGLPALQKWLNETILNPINYTTYLIPDEQPIIEEKLIELADTEGCDLILTTGGTGPHIRDVTPEATMAVATRVMPGFGEQMRQISLHYVPTAILSRQLGVLRNQTLIVNLPGKPTSIAETLGGVKNKEGKTVVHGIFAAIPMCVETTRGPIIKIREE